MNIILEIVLAGCMFLIMFAIVVAMVDKMGTSHKVTSLIINLFAMWLIFTYGFVVGAIIQGY